MQKFLERTENEDADLCDQCESGIFIKIENPESGDFNEDGYLSPLCAHCGIFKYGDEITDDKGTANFKISNRFIDKIVHFLLKGKNNVEKNDRKRILRSLKNRDFDNVDDFIHVLNYEITSLGYTINIFKLGNIVYKKIDPLVDFKIAENNN